MCIHTVYMYYCNLIYGALLLGLLVFQVRQKNIAEWQKSGLVKDVLHTTTRPETLNPIWNEHFELLVIHLYTVVCIRFEVPRACVFVWG